MSEHWLLVWEQNYLLHHVLGWVGRFCSIPRQKNLNQYELMNSEENLQCHFEYDEEYQVDRYPRPIHTAKRRWESNDRIGFLTFWTRLFSLGNLAQSSRRYCLIESLSMDLSTRSVVDACTRTLQSISAVSRVVIDGLFLALSRHTVCSQWRTAPHSFAVEASRHQYSGPLAHLFE